MAVDRAFLLEEIDNVERCLNESLRHDYGEDHGAGFFQECRQRLDALRLVAAQTNNLGGLQSLAGQTIDLANLISRIERSHRGEISWAFAERIAALAQLVCTDQSGSDSTKNLFYFGSEGGIDNYAVYPEQYGAKLANARIFSVIFPRTLRHHVLLHPILGHELGHAARAVPSIDNFISDVLGILSDESPLDEAQQFKEWLKANLPQPGTDLESLPDSWFEEVSKYWLDELFCDLFGLLIFGPSYIGAHCTLLCTVDPLGPSWDNEHPPVTCRLRLMYAAATHLGWLNYCDELGRPFAVVSQDLWPNL